MKTAKDFLNEIGLKSLQEIDTNVSFALRFLFMRLVTVARAERSFSKLKLIKTFHFSTMMDDKLSSLAMLSTKRVYDLTLKYDLFIDAFVDGKARCKAFC